MGKLQQFDITFSQNKVVYSPGETLSGTVRLSSACALPYKAIKVNCVGSCGVSSRINDTSWVAEEQYVSSMLSVADKGTLPPGEHSFPFQFLIPAHAPTSFEGPFGKVLYKIRAVIDTPRFSKDYKAQRPFYLLNVLNLNEVPDIEQPSCAETTKKFNYFLVKTGTLTLQAHSDLRGYVPGQIIRLSTEIHNRSGKATGCILASLIQKVTYRMKRPLFDLRTIVEVEGAGVKAGKHAEWNEQIIVPPLPQSELAGCSLIDIEYFIQVSLKSPETVVTLPIYIGNIAVNLTPTRLMPPNRLQPRASMPMVPGLGQTMVVPSAPPVEDDQDELQGASGLASEQIPTNSHSQQDPSGQALAMTPGAFSHAPSQALPQRLPGQSTQCSAPLFCVSTGATIPFFTDDNATPVPTTCPLILPPEYSCDYPHEPPPTYEESCSSNNSSFNTSMT